MQHTISISLDQEGIPTSAYSVLLANNNPSASPYGILDLTSSTEIAPWGTSVTENSTGVYSYTFNVENGHIYDVSWEVIANDGDDPSYRNYQVGPFFSVTDDGIRAVSSFSGEFTQGSFATLMLKITNFEGNPIDAEDIYIEIYNTNGELVTLDNNTPSHVDNGFYVIDWEIPDEQEEGEYRVIWHYVVDDIDQAEIQDIVVSEDTGEAEPLWYSGRVLDFKIALEHHLCCAQSIPIYFEQAKTSRDSRTYYFSFKNWNQSPGVKIYRNEKIVNSGVEVDYFKGKVTFDEALLPQETINADYNFRWFSDEELHRFLVNAIQTINIFPPHTAYDFDNLPGKYVPIVLYKAAADALRQLMLCLQFQEPQQIFGGRDAADRAFQGFETLKQNFEKDWEKLVEQKKFGPYPKTQIIVTPEYTLPGGRSRWFRMLFKGG